MAKSSGGGGRSGRAGGGGGSSRQGDTGGRVGDFVELSTAVTGGPSSRGYVISRRGDTITVRPATGNRRNDITVDANESRVVNPLSNYPREVRQREFGAPA